MKQEKQSGVIYKIPCQTCEKVYIGETGRALEERLKEHKTDVAKNSRQQFTRTARKQSEGEFNKSAITDHCNKENHVINWENTRIIGREDHTQARRIKEAIEIHRHQTMNRDVGALALPATYQSLILQRKKVTPPALCKNRKS